MSEGTPFRMKLYWSLRMKIAGDENVDLSGMTLEVIDSLIHGGTKGTVHDESDPQTASQF